MISEPKSHYFNSNPNVLPRRNHSVLYEVSTEQLQQLLRGETVPYFGGDVMFRLSPSAQIELSKNAGSK